MLRSFHSFSLFETHITSNKPSPISQNTIITHPPHNHPENI